ncbi:MAG: RepA family replication protein [Candidatus Symbiodolus clandestinus]
MTGVADVLQRLFEQKIDIPADSQGLETTFPLLSEATKQRIQYLCDTGAAEKQLLTILKNQKHQLELTDESKKQIVKKPATTAIKFPTEPVPLTKPKRRSSKNTPRIAYVLNPFPAYQAHEWLGKTPPLTQNLVQTATRPPAAFWDHLHALHKIRNMRIKVSLHRVNAIRALLPCLCATMNISSQHCLTNEQALAKQCGLTSSRASRALKDLADCGLITKQLNRTSRGTYQPLIITLSRKLLGLLGVSELRLNRAQQLHKKLSKASSQRPSLTQKVACSVTHSLSRVKQVFKGATSKPSRSNPSTNHLVQQVETLLQRFGLGRTENVASG